MSTFEMNKHECRAAAAWANPKQEHDVESVSMNYVSQQLNIAAAADCEGPGAKLLNEGSIPARLQILAAFRHCDQLLNLPTDPTTKDIKNMIDTIYQMDLFSFTEYDDFEKKALSDNEVEYLAGVLIGKFYNNRKLCLPKNISSETIL